MDGEVPLARQSQLADDAQPGIDRVRPNTTRLSNESAYLGRKGPGHAAFRLFVADPGIPGANIRALVAELFLLAHSADGRLESLGAAEADRRPLCNIPFFA